VVERRDPKGEVKAEEDAAKEHRRLVESDDEAKVAPIPNEGNGDQNGRSNSHSAGSYDQRRRVGQPDENGGGRRGEDAEEQDEVDQMGEPVVRSQLSEVRRVESGSVM
jgi:hypothetical protein